MTFLSFKKCIIFSACLLLWCLVYSDVVNARSVLNLQRQSQSSTSTEDFSIDRTKGKDDVVKKEENQAFETEDRFVHVLDTPTQSPSILSCATDSDLFHLEYVELTPDPPSRGKQLRIQLHGYLDEDVVEGAYADVLVKYGLIKLLNQRMDICKEIQQVNLSCPIPNGEFSFDRVVDIPIQVFPGRYFVHATANNVDDKPINCLTAQFRMS